VNKSIIWVGAIVGSTLGGFIPILWGSDFLSFSSVIFTGLGGILGIWLGYRLNNY